MRKLPLPYLRKQNVPFVVTLYEYPKLIIIETSRDNQFAKESKILVDNLDAFTYINSKFVYLKKHMKTHSKFVSRRNNPKM